MSLILEALRKSEAERRRGQVPDLHAEPAPGALRVRDGPPAWLWLALAFATAMVLAIALWLARSALSLPPHAVDVAHAATGPAGVMSVDARGDTGASDEPGSTGGPSTLPDDRAGAAASLPTPGREQDPAQMPDAPAAAATPSTPPARAPATTKVASAPAASPAAAPAVPEPAAATVPAPVTRRAEVASAVVSAASTGEPAPLAAATARSALLRLSDLAVAERRQLPPLKMSMHMWAPTQRFAIIDGARVSEGDRIGDAVVEEITADGVVLAWQGQRLQIPTR